MIKISVLIGRWEGNHQSSVTIMLSYLVHWIQQNQLLIGGYKYHLREVDNGYGDSNHSQSQQQHRDNIRNNNIITSSVTTIRGTTTSTWTISVTKTLLHHQSQPSGTTSNS